MGNPGRQPQNRGRSRGPDIAGEIAKDLAQCKSLGEELTAEKVVELGERGGEHLKRVGLKTSQIRKFLDGVNRIKVEGHLKGTEEGSFFRGQCQLLRPQLAYAAARQRETVEPLQKMLEPCLKKVASKKDFDRLHQFVEALIAYHRYYGGKD